MGAGAFPALWWGSPGLDGSPVRRHLHRWPHGRARARRTHVCARPAARRRLHRGRGDDRPGHCPMVGRGAARRRPERRRACGGAPGYAGRADQLDARDGAGHHGRPPARDRLRGSRGRAGRVGGRLRHPRRRCRGHGAADQHRRGHPGAAGRWAGGWQRRGPGSEDPQRRCRLRAGPGRGPRSQRGPGRADGARRGQRHRRPRGGGGADRAGGRLGVRPAAPPGRRAHPRPEIRGAGYGGSHARAARHAPHRAGPAVPGQSHRRLPAGDRGPPAAGLRGPEPRAGGPRGVSGRSRWCWESTERRSCP